VNFREKEGKRILQRVAIELFAADHAVASHQEQNSSWRRRLVVRFHYGGPDYECEESL
jgi:hypothetical protein